MLGTKLMWLAPLTVTCSEGEPAAAKKVWKLSAVGAHACPPSPAA